MQTQQAADHTPPELTETHANSLGGFVGALFGDTPFLSGPDMPVRPDKWDSSFGGFGLGEASVPKRVYFLCWEHSSHPICV